MMTGPWLARSMSTPQTLSPIALAARTAIDRSSPIINPPQVAILGVTRVAERAVVRDGAIVAAPMMGLHLVFDHRAVDGYPAAVFLGDLARRIETAAL